MIAGLELGGTKCVAILGNGPDDIAEQVIVPTTDPDTTLAALEAVLDRWTFDAIGIASFGPLDLVAGAITTTVKPGWSGTELLARFAARYGVPTHIQTDVVGAALAEGRWGAARGLTDHLYITVGTGIGVGSIVGERPAGGEAHGEGGHMRVARARGDSFAGLCPFHGDCVEGLASGPALAARAGIQGTDIPGDHPVWAYFAHDIAGLLHNLVVTLAPQRIAIGGGVLATRPALFVPIRRALAASLADYGMFAAYAAELEVRIGPPGLGDRSGALGAIAVGLG